LELALHAERESLFSNTFSIAGTRGEMMRECRTDTLSTFEQIAYLFVANNVSTAFMTNVSGLRKQ
jgi:hypothetical protein